MKKAIMLLLDFMEYFYLTISRIFIFMIVVFTPLYVPVPRFIAMVWFVSMSVGFMWYYAGPAFKSLCEYDEQQKRP